MGISLTHALQKQLQQTFKFKWTTTAIKYLGTHIPADLTKVYSLNFLPLLHSLRLYLEKWQGGLFSWFGRNNILKMMVLPKILYLFQTLPIYIPMSFFKSLTGLFTTFLWAGKRPRIRRTLLTRGREQGGIALPDLYQYYSACHLTRLLDWFKHIELKHWISLEQSFTDFPLAGLAWCSDKLLMPLLKHPTIGPSLKTCKRAFSSFDLTSLTSPLFPIIDNPAFPPGSIAGPFQALRIRKKTLATDFLASGQWVSLSLLTDQDGPYKLQWWQALQLKHFLQSLPDQNDFSRPLTAFEKLCRDPSPLRHSLSILYSLLRQSTSEQRLYTLTLWERDLNTSFSPQQVNRITQMTFRSSICTKLQELNYKLLIRWYRTPSFLNTIYPDVPDTCWRCQRERGTLMHIFWSCTALRSFWTGVHHIAQKMTDYTLPMEPALFLLHSSDLPLQSYRKSILRHLFNAAKLCIPLMWKNRLPPTITMWLHKVEEIRRLEDLFLSSQNKHDVYLQTWTHWLLFTESPEGIALLAKSTSSTDET